MANIGKISSNAKAYARKQQLANDEKYRIATGYNRETGDYYPIFNTTNYDIVCEKWLKPVISNNYYKSIEWKRKAVTFTEQWQHDVTLLLKQMLKATNKQAEKTAKTEKAEYVPVNEKCKEMQALTPKQKVFEIKTTKTKTKTVYLPTTAEKRSQGTAKHKDTRKKKEYRIIDSKNYETFKPSITTQTVNEKYCHFIINGIDIFYSFNGTSVYDKDIMDYVKKPLLIATYATYNKKEGFKGSYTLKKLTREVNPENFSIYDVLEIAHSAWKKTHYTESTTLKHIFRMVDSLRLHGYKLNLPLEHQKKLEGNIKPLTYAINKYLQPLLKIDLEGIVADVLTLYMIDYDIIKICAKLKGFYLLTQDVRHGFPLNSITELSDVQAEYWTLWDNFYLSYRNQKKKNLANVFETVKDEDTEEKKKQEVKAQIVPLEEAEQKPALSFCDIQDNRLDSICWLIHVWGDDSRYYQADIGNNKEGVKLRRELKKRMETALNTCGYPEGKAGGGDYRKLCELAYCKYCA